MRMVSFLALLLLPATGWSADPLPDPFLGKWSLDARASKYADHRCPKRMTINMTAEGSGIHYHSETEPAVGETFHVDYSANYDGKPVIVTGDHGLLLPVSLRRVSPDHVVATYTSALRVMATSERTVSADGKVMTVSTTSNDAFGQKQTNIGIYHRFAASR